MLSSNERVEDIRAYVFALFEVDCDGENGIYVETRRFLGTGFFVSPKGDALTAAHVLPKGEDVDPQKKRVVAAIVVDGKKEFRFVVMAATLPQVDVAIFKVNITGNPFLAVDDTPSDWGDNFVSIGVPEHEVRNNGKEMRLLKGHISMISDVWELSVPIPPGMSGSPIFRCGKVVGVGLGFRRAESLDDYHEEIEQITNQREKITIAKVVKVVEYGTAFPFENIANARFEILGAKGLLPFINEQSVGATATIVASGT